MDHFDLGPHTRAISASSPEAQRWFNLGLNWCYGFNRQEAIKCFRKALEFDSKCVMAHWGMAYAAGPFYNLAWHEYGEQEADTATKLGCDHIMKARASAGSIDLIFGNLGALRHAKAYRIRRSDAGRDLLIRQDHDFWQSIYFSHWTNV